MVSGLLEGDQAMDHCCQRPQVSPEAYIQNRVLQLSYTEARHHLMHSTPGKGQSSWCHTASRVCQLRYEAVSANGHHTQCRNGCLHQMPCKELTGAGQGGAGQGRAGYAEKHTTCQKLAERLMDIVHALTLRSAAKCSAVHRLASVATSTRSTTCPCMHAP